MTLSYVYTQVNKAMLSLQSVDVNDMSKRSINQKSIHKAYELLDSLKDDLIREHIKAKQKASKLNEKDNK